MSDTQENTWAKTCPICGADTKWKLSGRGRHYGQLCETHGFVAIRRNPVLAEIPAPVPRKPGFFERFCDYAMGR